MRNRMIVIVPVTHDQGSTRYIAAMASSRETLRQNALWQYNKMREHDGQAPLTKMPNGTRYEPVPLAPTSMGRMQLA